MKKSQQGICEGKIRLAECAGVFYNPEMRLCRDICSLAVGALGGKLSVLDAMCASGVRGLRYKKENKNVAKLALCDYSAKAVACARKNAALNKAKCAVKKADAGAFLRQNSFDFVELDPFGSPQPFLHDAAYSFKDSKGGFLSLTATDMAVLCGAHHAACLKNYGAAPLDNEFCHENAVRILIGKAMLEFAPFNLALAPLFSFSHRHYVKVVLAVSRGSEAAVGAVKSLGFVSYCPGCCWRKTGRLPSQESCPGCSHQLQIAGPIYLGNLWDGKVLERMLALNAERKLERAREIEKILRTMLQESRIASYGYYDLHTLAKKNLAPIMAIERALAKLHKAGFSAARTHFCPTAVRTDAPHSEVLKLVK